MNRRKLRTFDNFEIEYFKKHSSELKKYIEVALAEYQKDGDEKAFLASLSVAARVHGGFTRLAKETGLNRENLYRALSDRSDPRFSTIMQVLSKLGYSLKIVNCNRKIPQI